MFWSCWGVDANSISKALQKKHQQKLASQKGPGVVWKCDISVLSLSLSLSSLSTMLFGAYTFSMNTLNSLSTFPYLSRNVQGELEK